MAHGETEAEEQCGRTTRKRVFALIGMVLGPVVGALLGFTIPLVWNHYTGPPPDTKVTGIMDQEVAAGNSRGIPIVQRIYAPDATVTDAACLTAGASTTWHGLSAIESRYSSLPSFQSLSHVEAHVIWEPNDWQANRAEVTADTNGVIAPSSAWPNGQPLNGHELWVFARSGDNWVIRSFTYNLCLP